MKLDLNGNPPLHNVTAHKIPNLVRAPLGAYIGGPGVPMVKVTTDLFPELDSGYAIERDRLAKERK